MRPLLAVLSVIVLFVLGAFLGSMQVNHSVPASSEEELPRLDEAALVSFEEDSAHARSAMKYYDQRPDTEIGRILHLIDEQRGYTRAARKSVVEAVPTRPAPRRVVRTLASSEFGAVRPSRKRALEPTGGEPFTPIPLKRFLADWAAYCAAATEPEGGNWREDFLERALDQQSGLIAVDQPVILADKPGSRVPIVGKGTVFYTLRGRIPRRLRARTLLDAEIEAQSYVSQRLAKRQAEINRRILYASAGGRRF